MKRPICALFAALALLIGATVYLSHRTPDGLDRRHSGAAGVLRGAIGASSSVGPSGTCAGGAAAIAAVANSGR